MNTAFIFDYDLDKLPEIYTKIIVRCRSIMLFWVPTEFVIHDPSQSHYPLQGRIWPTNRYVYDGAILTCDELRDKVGISFRGYSDYPEVVISEWWEDYGDDGHTEYKLCKYRVGPIGDIIENLKENDFVLCKKY